ncbi:hypothetical protein JH25_07800 [Pseudomonas sp. BRG-100]|uniref:hypothetical protein n=1 Tax=Pseudomonas sp. BRG-100 TaxID=1524267 RepID=UPI0004E7C075|nr:hypothetical protein [Pseudomonas sp. BRG-100]KFF43678.1 hypothetical protein JH25_07800 [Pseudomonas sp. BRG-100]
MTDYTDLQKAAEYAAQDTIKFADEEEEMRALQQFHEEVDPVTVLALLAENDHHAMCARQWEEAAMQWGAERDQLKAENEALRREREGKVLCDLELFETLRDAANTEADEHRQCMATYRPLRQANLDSVVKKCDDLLAAMGKGEQS